MALGPHKKLTTYLVIQNVPIKQLTKTAVKKGRCQRSGVYPSDFSADSDSAVAAASVARIPQASAAVAIPARCTPCAPPLCPWPPGLAPSHWADWTVWASTFGLTRRSSPCNICIMVDCCWTSAFCCCIIMAIMDFRSPTSCVVLAAVALCSDTISAIAPSIRFSATS